MQTLKHSLVSSLIQIFIHITHAVSHHTEIGVCDMIMSEIEDEKYISHIAQIKTAGISLTDVDVKQRFML